MSNSTGSYRTTTENMMLAFDKLPSELRQALANSHVNWVPQPVLSLYLKKRGDGGATDAKKHCLKLIERWNNEAAEEHWYKMRRLEKNGTSYDTPIRRTAIKRQKKVK